MASIFYVRAEAKGNFAECTYYTNKEGTGDPIPGSSFSVPKDTGTCTFAEADGSSLTLIGATFSSLGGAPGMNSGNFAPAVGRAIKFDIPTGFVTTKGVVLLFSNQEYMDNIYPSSDPQITNDGALPHTAR